MDKQTRKADDESRDWQVRIKVSKHTDYVRPAVIKLWAWHFVIFVNLICKQMSSFSDSEQLTISFSWYM